MDPITAMAIIAVVTTGASLYMGNQSANAAAEEQDRLRKEQEAARVAATQREIGVAAQRTNTALSGAATRKVGSNQSFSPTSVMAGLPSVSGNKPQAASGSTGTF